MLGKGTIVKRHRPVPGNATKGRQWIYPMTLMPGRVRWAVNEQDMRKLLKRRADPKYSVLISLRNRLGKEMHRVTMHQLRFEIGWSERKNETFWLVVAVFNPLTEQWEKCS